MKIVEFDEQCKSCHGTGLYKGMAEGDGFVVVCHTCKVTGCHHFTHQYEDFIERIESPETIQVVKTNPGIILGTRVDLTYESFGGMSYTDWKRGLPFPPKSEMRAFSCPCWWYQLTDYKKKPDWKKCKDNLGRSFSQCLYFPGKAKCWERFDKEYNESL